MVTLFKGVQNQMVAWIVLISVGVIAAPAQVSPTAIFLDGPGEPQAFTYGISTLANAGGVLTDWGDALTGSATYVASTRGPQGDVYIAGIDPIGGLWINQLRSGTQTWVGWISAGMPFQAQSVDLAVAADGTVWLAAASPSGDIWLNSYTPSTGF